jgi:hypothetical protein
VIGEQLGDERQRNLARRDVRSRHLKCPYDHFSISHAAKKTPGAAARSISCRRGIQRQRSSEARTMRTQPRRLTPSEQRLAAALDPDVARRLIALRNRVARLALLPDISPAMLGAIAAEVRSIRAAMDHALDGQADRSRQANNYFQLVNFVGYTSAKPSS